MTSCLLFARMMPVSKFLQSSIGGFFNPKFMNYFNRKINIVAISVIFVFQMVFPHFTYAYVITNSGMRNSVVSIANSPQEIMFDAISNDQKAKLPQSAPRSAHKKVRVSMTAYSSTPGQTDSTPFITANGSHVKDGIVAANFLPFGTKVRIPEVFGDKVFSVEDRMNARYYYKIDVWMPTYEEAKNFGIKYVEVEIF